jgi:fatty-acid desaturase
VSGTTGRRLSGRALAVMAAQAVALAALFVAWYGASREVRMADQWRWGAVSVAALAASAMTNAAVIIGLRRRLAHAAEEF